MVRHQTYTSGDGLTLAYRDQPGGDPAAPAIVCLPGMTRNGRDFDAFARSLPGRRVIALDFRGRGASAWAADPMTYRPSVYVEDVRALLDAADVGRAVLVGASLGGAVAMLAASRLGSRIAGLILNDAGTGAAAADPARIAAFLKAPLTARDWAQAAAQVQAAQGASFPGYGARDWIAAARRLCARGADGIIRADYDPALAVPYETPGGLEDWDREAVFAALGDLPMLVVRGALSTVLAADTVAAMRLAAPHIRTVEVSGVGHHPDLTEPEAARAITAFLA